jgi:hypothetical protein
MLERQRNHPGFFMQRKSHCVVALLNFWPRAQPNTLRSKASNEGMPSTWAFLYTKDFTKCWDLIKDINRDNHQVCWYQICLQFALHIYYTIQLSSYFLNSPGLKRPERNWNLST